MAAAPEQFGPYTVYEQLGAGGMAVVHRAETAGIEGWVKPVALKRMLPHYASSEDFIEAFIREARIASRLHHVNIAQTYELGKFDDIYFIAMELVTGRSLSQILRHLTSLSVTMPVPITLNILNQICDALDYAHHLCDESGQRLGIIHRDVSPSNVIVSDAGLVKLIDFGIAKSSAADMQTQSGRLKGKFGYMAPEYIAGAIDARADLFAVGVIAHELLTNRPLFTGGNDLITIERLRGMTVEPPSVSNPEVPHEIDELVMTALERDPKARWQHATALRTALTTQTKRLGLEVMNSEVATWLDSLFAPGAPMIQRNSPEENTLIEIAPITPPTPVAPPPALAPAPARPAIASDDPLDYESTVRRPGRGSQSPLRNSGLDPGRDRDSVAHARPIARTLSGSAPPQTGSGQIAIPRTSTGNRLTISGPPPAASANTRRALDNSAAPFGSAAGRGQATAIEVRPSAQLDVRAGDGGSGRTDLASPPPIAGARLAKPAVAAPPPRSRTALWVIAFVAVALASAAVFYFALS